MDAVGAVEAERARGLRLLSALLAAILIAVMPLGALAAEDAPSASDTWRFSDVSVLPEQPAAGDIATISFSVLDEDGAPVEGLRVSASLRAPSNAYNAEPPRPILTAAGRPVSTDGGDVPGRYEVTLALNQAGRWWVELDVTDAALGAARHNHFMVVEPAAEPVAHPVESPVFFPGDAWGSYYRLDSMTGSLVRMAGHEIIRAGGQPWIVDTHLQPTQPATTSYGGVWRLTVELRDGLTGAHVSTIDAGAIRASVYVGSADEPAIVRSLVISADGARAYLYWTRQLGQGWLGWVAAADVATGEILQRRMLEGAIGADGALAKINLSPDGRQLVIAEQFIRSGGLSGYRLLSLDAGTLETIAEHRRPTASDDPLTRCLLTYPRPSGGVASDASLRYSLCSPTGHPRQIDLLVWDPIAGAVVHQADLSDVIGESPYYVDGVASPDGRHFYVVNTLSRRVIEIDLLTGATLRQASLLAQPEQPAPSPLDRLVDWLFGMVARDASASILVDPGVSISADGSTLYFVAPASTRDRAFGDGVWVVDTRSLTLIGQLLPGQPVSGVVVTPNGYLAIVRPSASNRPEEIMVVDPTGQTLISLTLPESDRTVSLIPQPVDR